MSGPTITRKMSFTRTPSAKRHRKVVAKAEEHVAAPATTIPRITRLMALAVRFDQLIRDGVVKDYAELARVGGVSRARISQIMDLNMLAPQIQLKLLHSERPNTRERALRSAGRHLVWTAQLHTMLSL